MVRVSSDKAPVNHRTGTGQNAFVKHIKNLFRMLIDYCNTSIETNLMLVHPYKRRKRRFVTVKRVMKVRENRLFSRSNPKGRCHHNVKFPFQREFYAFVVFDCSKNIQGLVILLTNLLSNFSSNAANLVARSFFSCLFCWANLVSTSSCWICSCICWNLFWEFMVLFTIFLCKCWFRTETFSHNLELESSNKSINWLVDKPNRLFTSLRDQQFALGFNFLIWPFFEICFCLGGLTNWSNSIKKISISLYSKPYLS